VKFTDTIMCHTDISSNCYNNTGVLLTSHVSAQFFKVTSLLPQAHSFQPIEPEKNYKQLHCKVHGMVNMQRPAVNKVITITSNWRWHITISL